MTIFPDVDYLRGKALGQCISFRHRLNEFVDEFPGGAPLKLIEVITLFLKEIEAELATTTSASVLRTHFVLIDQLSVTLSWLDNAHTAQSPRGLVQFLEKTCDSIFPDALLLVSPGADYNYSIVDIVPSLRKMSSGAMSVAAYGRFVATLPTAFYIVRFPRVERENVLNHAIFGHEFGHPVADRFIQKHEKEPIYAQRLLAAQAKIQADPEITARLAGISDPVDKSRLLASLFDEAATIHRRGLEELVSDAVAAHLFGPSALFAAMDIFLQSALDAAPRADEFYPPSRYRLRLMLTLLDGAKHIQALRDLKLPNDLAQVHDAMIATLDYLAQLTSLKTDEIEIGKTCIVRVAYSWLEETLPEALAFAATSVQSTTFPANLIPAQTPMLLERLQLEVPPNEIGIWPNNEAADWRAALCASWLYALGDSLRQGLTSDERYAALLTTQRLALKGIEYALLQQAYGNFATTKGLST